MKKTFTKNIFSNLLSTVRLFLLVCLLAYAGNLSATIRYVTATGTGDGSDWTHASKELQSIIYASASGDEVWVAGGTYLPAWVFLMKEGVKIYGGFAGEEESLAQRDLKKTTNASILQGNRASVVKTYDLTSAALLDGFTITKGSESGIFNYNSSPTINNCLIINNSNNYSGGGIYNEKSSPILTNCLISNNEADVGAGIVNYDNSKPVLTNCSITKNKAKLNGGGVYSQLSSLELRNSIVYENSSGWVNSEGIVNEVSSADINYSLVEGFVYNMTGSHNISNTINPLFVDPANGDYRLQACSPLINKGSNEYYDDNQTPDLSAILIDLAGNPRFHNGDQIDLGAYQYKFSTAVVSANGIVYVKSGGIGSGESWACPTGDLQAAINAAASGQQVWVAAGTYLPDSGQSFVMKEGVKIYGGFRGTEEALTERDLSKTAYTSILQANGASVVFNDRNGLTPAAVLDGFTITGAVANKVKDIANGIYNHTASPTLANLIVTNNSSMNGGGIANHHSSPILTNCYIRGNKSGFGDPDVQGGTGGQGGGMYNYYSSPTLINCFLTDNDSNKGAGGGMFNNNSAPVLINCSISDNKMTNSGGGMWNLYSSPILTNCLISNNILSDVGGSGIGIHNYDSSPVLTNCTISTTMTRQDVGVIYNGGASFPKLRNTIIAGNNEGIIDANTSMSDIEYSLVQGRSSTDHHNIPGSKDPLFVNAAEGDFRLQPCSPVVNKGSDSLYSLQRMPDASEITTDLDGKTRFYNAGRIDLGVYEREISAPVVGADGIVYVKASAGGTGESWECATGDLQGAINAAASGQQVWVAAGTYQPASGESFSMKEGVKIFGGFAGTEDNLTDRDLKDTTQKSILKGNGGSVIYNSWNGLTEAAVLDGFTITGGVSNGINNSSSSPTFINCLIRKNSAGVGGGGVYNYQSSSTFVNCTITDNDGNGQGGGMINYELSHAKLINCLIYNNRTTGTGGGISNISSSPILTNCTITGNTAIIGGGGIHNTRWSESSPFSFPEIRNTVVYGNSSGVDNDPGSVPVIQYSLVQGETNLNPDDHNLPGNTDPFFVDAVAGNFRLEQCSRAINNGSNGYYGPDSDLNLSAIITDLDGNSRFYESGIVDMGAFEYQGDLSLSVSGIRYVKAGEKGSGISWKCPTGDFQAAIDAAASGQQVWVAGGTYQPDSGQSFVMKEGVKIYGGFAGGEESLTLRDLTNTANASILKGNGSSVVTNVENNLTSAALLDGFTITGGSASGMYNFRSSPALINCSFANNTANYGGGMNNLYSSPSLTNCSFTYNTSGYRGGGIYNFGKSLPPLTNCSFTNNTSGLSGGGFSGESSSSTLINCSFSNNNTIQWGGGFYSEGSSDTLINCSFTKNTADYGGGVCFYYASPTLINCSIINNTAILAGGGIGNYYNSLLIKMHNSIVYGNNSGIYNLNSSSPDISYSLVQGTTNTDNHNISGNVDPLFIDPLNGDYRLKSCSPVINKGNSTYLSDVTIDLDGEARFYDGSIVDLGAYEFAGTPTAPSLAADEGEFSGAVSGDFTLMANGASCEVLASLSPNGTAPVSGEITAKVWVESTQPQSFVKRHYEITPTTNAETATARVTLYFTQQEFTDFNTVSSVKLPVDAADTQNYKTNLRIEKRSGSSDNNSGLPGSYDGAVVTINPLDPTVNGSITWNADASRWEVSFDVTGFSGFFAKTTETSLPVSLISFTGSKEKGSNQLNWKTTNEVNFSHFIVQHSRNASSFTDLAIVESSSTGIYHYTHNSPFAGINYYRLKMVDRDETFAQSKMISLNNEGNRTAVYPNPASVSITLDVNPALLKTSATLYDITGRELQTITIVSNQQEINVKSLASGVYILKFADGTTERFVKE